MRVLVIAGTGYIGGRVVERLVAGGHDVTVVHRGEHEAPGPGDVRHIHCDRASLDRNRAECRPDAMNQPQLARASSLAAEP